MAKPKTKVIGIPNRQLIPAQPKKFIGERVHRVKLLNLADLAQAVWSIRDEAVAELKIYLFDSEGGQVQLFAPFQFPDQETRDLVFKNDEKLTDFANAVIVGQMAGIDPKLNTDNFKKVE
jgi:hypothetical protein